MQFGTTPAIYGSQSYCVLEENCDGLQHIVQYCVLFSTARSLFIIIL